MPKWLNGVAFTKLPSKLRFDQLVPYNNLYFSKSKSIKFHFLAPLCKCYFLQSRTILTLLILVNLTVAAIIFVYTGYCLATVDLDPAVKFLHDTITLAKTLQE